MRRFDKVACSKPRRPGRTIIFGHTAKILSLKDFRILISDVTWLALSVEKLAVFGFCLGWSYAAVSVGVIGGAVSAIHKSGSPSPLAPN